MKKTAQYAVSAVLLLLVTGVLILFADYVGKEDLRFAREAAGFFEEHYTEEMERTVYYEATTYHWQLDQYIADHGDSLHYELWKSEQKDGSIWVYAKLTGFDTENYTFSKNCQWERWLYAADTWKSLGNFEPRGEETPELLGTVTVVIPAPLLIPKSAFDREHYAAMSKLLLAAYDDDPRASVAYLNTQECYAILPLRKEDPSNRYDRYEFILLSMEPDPGDPAAMRWAGSMLYGTHDMSEPMNRFCDRLACCDSVLQFHAP